MNKTISQTESSAQFYQMQQAAGSGIHFAGLDWDPAPFVSMSIEKYTVGEYVIGGLLNVTLNGVFHNQNFSTNASTLQNKITSLASKNKCIQDINIGCNGSYIIESGVGWIKSYSFAEGDQKNWQNIIPYTIELAVISHDGSSPVVSSTTGLTNYTLQNYLKSYKETITLNQDDKLYQTYKPSGVDSGDSFSNAYATIKYSIEAQGIGLCHDCIDASGIVGGIKAAKNMVDNRWGKVKDLSTDPLMCSGLDCFKSGYYDLSKKYNHIWDVSVDELNGTYSINGEYIIRPSGLDRPDILLTLNSNADSNIENGEINISVNGNIKQLHSGDFDLEKAITQSETALNQLVTSDGENILQYIKDKNNLLKFNQHKGDLMKPLAFGAGGTWSNHETWTGADTSPYRLLQKSFKRNHSDHSIDFTLAYSNKNKYKIPNALWADINIEHEMPARRLVEHVVPGRGYPITQDILCDTLDIFTITVNAQFEPTDNIHKVIGGARQSVFNLINKTYNDLGLTNWVRTSDSESIGNNGSYRRTQKFTRHSCFDANALTYTTMTATET